MSQTTLPKLAQSKHYIYDTLDLSEIVGKLTSKKGWRKRHAIQACVYYRNFLWLMRKEMETNSHPQFPPSLDIDAIWHQHILYTKQYYEDCQAIFGKYLHHLPVSIKEENSKTSQAKMNQQFEHLQDLHQKEFGDFIYELRSWLAHFWGIVKFYVSSKGVI